MKNVPIVALVGRPNVGKSTLFNRIIGQRLAVVDNRPGTTRDRQYADGEWLGKLFTLVDTGGIELLIRATVDEPIAEDSSRFITEIREQAEIAIADADAIIFVVDLVAGITSADEAVADILRRSSKPIIVAASKGDNPKRREDAYEFYNLGIGDEVFPVSGMHGHGIGDLLDAMIEVLPHQVEDDFSEEDDTLKIAIMGRPNVGKSTLVNKMLGQERVIASPVAGTTRDAIDLHLNWHGQEITLIDTAGIRRRGKVEPGVEKYSVLRALKAIKRADVVLMLIDIEEGPTAQDAHVAGMILDEMRSAIVIANKWDAVIKDTHSMDAYTKVIRDDLRFMSYVPLLFISALTGQRVDKILPMASDVYESRYHRMPTSQINKIVRDAVMRQQAPQKAGTRLKIRYVSQVAVDPPKFLFHVNNPDIVHFSYQRYLENSIRAVYPFAGTPLQMEFKSTKEDRKRR